MNVIYILAFVTFALVLAFLGWNYMSTRRHQQTGGGNTAGIGGENDPMSGTASGIRDAEELRQSMDQAAVRAKEPQPIGTIR